MHDATNSVVLAFDVGGTTVKGGLFSFDQDKPAHATHASASPDISATAESGGLTLLGETRRNSEKGPAILEVIAGVAEDLVAAGNIMFSDVAAVGVAMPGLVDGPNGRSVRSVNLDLTDLDVATPLTARWGVPVRVGHDVGAAAQAVHHAGLAGDNDVVVVMGTGVASVTFVDGTPLPGACGQAGELGHVVVRTGGRPCACGALGCLEAYAGARAILEQYRTATGSDVAGVAEMVALAAHDGAAARIWSDALSALGDALLTVCALLAPGGIVIAGGLAEAGDQLTDPVLAHMRAHAGVVTVPPVRIARLGRRAGMYGAALLALDEFTDWQPATPAPMNTQEFPVGARR